jgi:two-component system sensor histidine kinase MprB
VTRISPVRPLQRFTRRIVITAAATLTLFSLTTLAAVAWHMNRDVEQHAAHSLALLSTDHGPGLDQALALYNRPNESRIWLLRHGHPAAKSANARGTPPSSGRTGFVQSANAYQLASTRGTQTWVIDVPLANDEALISLLLIALFAGSAVGTAIIKEAAGWLIQQTLGPVRSMTMAAGHMLNTGAIEPLPVPASGDEFYQLAILLNRLLADLQDQRQRERAQLADVTHHLRTPLTVIQGNLSVLRHAVPQNDASRSALQSIGSTVVQMKNLVSDLLIMERASSLAPNLMETMSFLDLLNEVVEYARAIVSDYPHIRLTVAEAWPHGVNIRVQPEFARRAFLTIVDNAVKYCAPADGHIGFIPAIDIPGFTGVTVVNDGPGISPADMPHIFKRFYRGSPWREIPGSGLGLSLARSLMVAQKGTIDVASRDGLTLVTLRFRNSP